MEKELTIEQYADIQRSICEVLENGYGEVRIVIQDGEVIVYQEIKTKKKIAY